MIATSHGKRILSAIMLAATLVSSACRDNHGPMGDQPIAVAVDHAMVPFWILDDTAAEGLRQRIIAKLEREGVRVTDAAPASAMINGPVQRPTLLVYIGMIPDGSLFVTTLYFKGPASSSSGNAVITWASHPYWYLPSHAAHSPVLDYLDDFLAAHPNLHEN